MVTMDDLAVLEANIWPPTGNDLRRRSPRPKFGSKVVEFNAQTLRKYILNGSRIEFWVGRKLTKVNPVGGHARLQ